MDLKPTAIPSVSTAIPSVSESATSESNSETHLTPNTNITTRWYVVTVGKKVGVFNDWSISHSFVFILLITVVTGVSLLPLFFAYQGHVTSVIPLARQLRKHSNVPSTMTLFASPDNLCVMCITSVIMLCVSVVNIYFLVNIRSKITVEEINFFGKEVPSCRKVA